MGLGRQIALTVVFCFTALGLAYIAARVFGDDPGTAGDLMAGATTESAAVGTATDAINRLDLAAATKQALPANAAVALAVTYLLGVLTTLTFLARVGFRSPPCRRWRRARSRPSATV